MTRRVLVEACVGSLAESIAGERAGADRLELCENLDVGGTTPGDDLVRSVKSAVSIPVSMMIRPRGGSFVHTASEIEHMHRDIDRAHALRADMLVLGVLDARGHVDVEQTRALVAHAGPTPVTFHKAFDEIVDLDTALEQLIECGVARVLTSAGARTAAEGADRLGHLVERARGRIVIMAGGRVRAHTLGPIVHRGNVREVHARCLDNDSTIRDLVLALDAAEPS